MNRSKIYIFISQLAHSLDASEQGFSLKKVIACGFFLLCVVMSAVYVSKFPTEKAFETIIDGTHWIMMGLLGLAVADKKIVNKTPDGKA